MQDPMGFDVIEHAPGVRLYVQPTRQFKRVTIALFIEQRLDIDYASPTALLPRVLRRGTVSYPETVDLERVQAELYGARLDTSTLKIGERHVIMFSLNLPAEKYVGVSGLFEQALRLLVEVVTQPALDGDALRPDYVAQETQQLVSQIRRFPDNKPSYARWRCIEEMCRREAYGVYSLGTIERLQAETGQSLYNYLRQLQRDNPISVYAVGDFDRDRMLELLQRSLRFARSGNPVSLPPTRVDVPAPAEVRVIDESQDMSQGWLVMGYRTGIARAHEDYYPMLVFNHLFGGSPFSRLFLQVREKASMAYSAGSSYDGNKGVLFAMAGIDPRRRAEAQQLIEEHLADLAAGNVGEQELSAAKAGVITDFRQRQDSAGQTILSHLSGRIGGRVDSTTAAVAAVEKVTAAEVAAVARRMVLDTVYFLHPRG